MKRVVLICLFVSSFSYSCEKQTTQDLFAHFKKIGYYSELLRLCTYHIAEPKLEIIVDTLTYLQSQDQTMRTPIKNAWDRYGSQLLQSAQERYEQEKKTHPDLLDADINEENFAPLSNESYCTLGYLKTFNSWIRQQQ